MGWGSTSSTWILHKQGFTQGDRKPGVVKSCKRPNGSNRFTTNPGHFLGCPSPLCFRSVSTRWHELVSRLSHARHGLDKRATRVGPWLGGDLKEVRTAALYHAQQSVDSQPSVSPGYDDYSLWPQPPSQIWEDSIKS